MTSGQVAFPALPDLPAPAPPAHSPVPQAPASPAPIAPVGKFQRVGGGVQYKTVKYLFGGGRLHTLTIEFFATLGGAVDPWTNGIIWRSNRFPLLK